MCVLSNSEILKRILIGELILLNMEKEELNYKSGEVFNIIEENKTIILKILDLLKNPKCKWEKIKEKYKKIEENNNEIYNELKRKLKLNRKELRMKLIKKIAENVKNNKSDLRDCVAKYIRNEDILHINVLPIFIDNFNIENLKPTNYDFRIGEEVYTTEEKYPIKLNKDRRDVIRIEPGSFGLFLTYEYIFLPQDVYGLISLRFKYKIKGLINVSGFHVEPGYHGKILFGVYNSGPSEIILRYKQSVFMITFFKVDQNVINLYKEGFFKDIPPKYIEQLRGPPVSLKEVHNKVEKLETYFRWIEYLLVLIFIGIIIHLFITKL